jgi:hypothetical protein
VRTRDVVGDPRTTIVIITHNRCPELLSTLNRITALPEAPAIIVVDNASADGTGPALRQRHPAVRLISLDTNRGAVARNIGVAAARTPYVAFCDDDVWWDPGLSGPGLTSSTLRLPNISSVQLKRHVGIRGGHRRVGLGGVCPGGRLVLDP